MAMHGAGRLGQSIVNPKPLLSADHQAAPSQVRQMSGHGGLRKIERFVQMANANFTFHKQVQETKPDGIGKRLIPLDRGTQRIGNVDLHSHGRI